MAIKTTIPYNFDEIYSYVEAKFKDKGYDTEEGSDTMQLVSAMSYLVSMLNANTATNINETLLTQARKRKMALYDARVLGYEIAHIQSYEYELELLFEEGSHTINKYDSFTAGDYTYYYMGDTIGPFTVNTGETEIKKIIVKEGNLTRYTDNESSLVINIDNVTDEETGLVTIETYVDVPFTNVEENGIEMFLTYYDEDATLFEKEEWTRSKQFMIDSDTSLSKEFVRLDNIDYGTPRLHFQFGNVGNRLRSGTIVYLNVLTSNGVNGAMPALPSTTDFDCTVNGYTLITAGAEEESLASIKTNAPLFNNSANRVVTKPDYVAFCNRQSSVKYTEVWDGHVEYPNKSGFIWFSFVPSITSRSIIDETAPVGKNYGDGTLFKLQNFYDNDNWYITDSSVNSVFSVLENYKIPTMTHVHRQPTYLDFEYDIQVARYSIQTSEADVNYSIFEVINNYFTGVGEDEAVETFGYEYFQSNLTKRIDQSLTDLMGFDFSLTNSIHFSDKNIIQETETGTPGVYYKEVRAHLGFPFTKIIDNNSDVVFDNLPDITTPLFDGVNDLTVDESSYVLDISSFPNVRMHTYNILLGTSVVGFYRIYSGQQEDIEIVLYVADTGGYTEGILLSDLDSSTPELDGSFGLTMNVKYPTPNIKMARNSIPRLKTVKFV